jgi:uncharacterized membrane protein YqaE (UPF0057 family)
MKKLGLLLVVAFMSTLILDSCTVQKRYHRKGFNVNWNHTSIGGKKDKNKVSYESSEEEVAEVKETKSTVKEVTNVASAYSNEVTTDFASTTDEISLVATVPVENKLNTRNESKEINILAPVSNSKEVKVSNKKYKGTIAEMKMKKFQEKGSSVEPWVYLLLILLVPFGTTIAMYLYEGSWTSRVTLNLILTLLCGLPGLIHALVIIFGNR